MLTSVFVLLNGIVFDRSNGLMIKCLKSDSHVPENFCQIKVIPSGVQKNSIICLFGV